MSFLFLHGFWLWWCAVLALAWLVVSFTCLCNTMSSYSRGSRTESTISGVRQSVLALPFFPFAGAAVPIVVVMCIVYGLWLGAAEVWKAMHAEVDNNKKAADPYY